MSDLAPIVLFVYNRPWHTLQTLEALSGNELSDESVLFVYCDGIKDNVSETDREKNREVESVVKSKKWCKETYFIKRDRNVGLADNIVTGVSEIVHRFGKVIVLEDDVVTSKGFLKFMNEALLLYEHDSKVMHVSGYMFPVEQNLPNTFFIRQSHCWGWATWKRSWNLFSTDTTGLIRSLMDHKSVTRFNAGSNYYEQLISNHLGKMKTWAVKWYATIFINDGLALHPCRTLVKNIGLDGSGVNSGTTERYDTSLSVERIHVRRIPLEESKEVSDILLNFHKQKLSNKKIFSIKSKLVKRSKGLLISILNAIGNTAVRVNAFRIRNSKNITIHSSVKLKSSTIAEVRYGGKIKIGLKTELLDHVCLLTYGGEIIIGDNCSINPFTIIYGHGGALIGNNVLIAAHCMVIPNSHNYLDSGKSIREQGHTSKGIIIEDDVWIGHGCTILDGATIGKGAIIAAGSVVRKSIPPFSIYGGVPARFIKNRFDDANN